MESLQSIEARKQNISSTQQITRSMRIVSSAKSQKIKAKMEANRPFFEQAIRMSEDVVKHTQDARHPYIVERPAEHPLMILIASDRGLCGGYNANVGKEMSALIRRVGGDPQVIAIGVKAREYCRRRRKKVVNAFSGISENPFYDDAKEIGRIALQLYDSKQVDHIYLVYTEYISMLTQTPKVVQLLPFIKEALTNEDEYVGIMRYEPGEDEFLRSMVSMFMDTTLYGAMLSSAASEQCARIMSMDAAEKNAGKIIDSLTLLHNQMRQGSITQELAEIIGGANAIGMD